MAASKREAPVTAANRSRWSPFRQPGSLHSNVSSIRSTKNVDSPGSEDAWIGHRPSNSGPCRDCGFQSMISSTFGSDGAEMLGTAREYNPSYRFLRFASFWCSSSTSTVKLGCISANRLGMSRLAWITVSRKIVFCWTSQTRRCLFTR